MLFPRAGHRLHPPLLLLPLGALFVTACGAPSQAQTAAHNTCATPSSSASEPASSIPTPPGTDIPPPTPSPTSTAPGTVGTSNSSAPKVESFDCWKVDEATPPSCDTEAEVSGTEAGQSLRDWKGGGPHGASWNAFQLQCSAQLSTPCEGGSLVFRIGQHVVHQLALQPKLSHQSCSFPVAYETLSKHLDQPGTGDAEAIYSTAMLRVELTQVCGDPPMPSVARDAFVAGFSDGE